MCKHKNLKFLGIQNKIKQGKKFFLYNCLDCMTTIALENKKTGL